LDYKGEWEGVIGTVVVIKKKVWSRLGNSMRAIGRRNTVLASCRCCEFPPQVRIKRRHRIRGDVLTHILRRLLLLLGGSKLSMRPSAHPRKQKFLGRLTRGGQCGRASGLRNRCHSQSRKCVPKCPSAERLKSDDQSSVAMSVSGSGTMEIRSPVSKKKIIG
jgi:hypothetical protein